MQSSKNDWFRPAVLSMKGYVPGEQPKGALKVVKLNTNENPYPPSPAIRKAAQRFAVDSLRLYPDPTAKSLRERLGELYRWNPDGVMVVNGSDEFLALLFRASVGKGDVVQCPDLTYSLYPVLCAERGGRYRSVPLQSDYSVDFRRFDPGARLTLFGYPNPPVGNLFPKRDILAFCRRAKGLVLIDEAYADFSGDSCLDIARRCPNILVLRTVSKAFSLAGLRLGYAFGHPSALSEIHKVRDSYNVDRLSQHLGLAAFSPEGLASMRGSVQKVVAERGRLTGLLRGIGFEIADSSANFVLAHWKNRPSAERLASSLKARGVLVRYFSLPRLEDCLRITVGTPSQSDRLVRELKKVCSKRA
jgi:histidinol-phosphate aminotransferase